jgi:hypothetical protein
LDLDTGHSAAVAADLLDGNPNALSSYVPTCGACGGRAVRLCGLRGVHAVQSDRDSAPNRPPDVVRVAVCDLDHFCSEGLPRFYRSVLGHSWGAEKKCSGKGRQEAMHGALRADSFGASRGQGDQSDLRRGLDEEGCLVDQLE